jgi:hypothetical protein
MKPGCGRLVDLTISLTQKTKGASSEFECVRSRDTSGGIGTDCGLDDGFDSRQWQVLSPLDTVCGAPGLMYSGYRVLFPRGVKLTTRLHPVPRSRISGAITSAPQHVLMEWCLMMNMDSFTFYFHLNWNV